MRSLRSKVERIVSDHVVSKPYCYEDYINLNPDLNTLNKIDAYNHWKTSGHLAMRLCNKNQLIVLGEFGQEIILYICYYYYLYKSGLLFNNKITTYKGMKSFYFFVDPSNIIERDELRKYIRPSYCPLMINNDEHVGSFDKRYWYPMPYKTYYMNTNFIYTKPVLVIQNKYNIEWNRSAINYFSVNILDSIFSKLCDLYTIVYIRPSDTLINLKKYSFSKDHNLILEGLDDYTLIHTKYKDKIILFDDLLLQHNLEYNILKLELYSSCDNYISVQGGGSHLISFFYKRLLLLHIEGKEIDSGAYNGWYLDTRPGDKELTIARTSNELINNLNMFL